MMKLSEIAIDKPLTIICHKDAPTDVVNDLGDVQSIDCFATEEWARGVTLDQWRQIKQMQGFTTPFRLVFTDLDLSEDLALQQHGAGVRHVAGLIALTYHAIFMGKRPFWVRPETHLHPSSQTGLADLAVYFMKLTTKGQTK